MKLWLLLTAAFILQEPVTTTGFLLKAYQAHYNLWIIHGLFVVATVVDIAAGYLLGKVLNNKLGTTRFIRYLHKQFDRFKKFAGEKGMIIALLLYSPLIFPISAIFIPWLEISIIEAAACIFLGELVFWYGYIWLLVLGANSFVSTTHTLFYIAIGISLFVSLGMGYYSRKKSS